MSSRSEVRGRVAAAILAEMSRQSREDFHCESTWLDFHMGKVADAALGVFDTMEADDTMREYMTEIGWW